MRVLLVEEGWHATLTLARELERAGVTVTVLTANGTSASVRRGGVEWTSGPAMSSPAFVPHVAALARHCDRVLPLTEQAMDILWDSPVASLVFPRTEPWQRALLRDKHALVEHMAGRGITIPRHMRVTDALDLAAAIDSLGMPLVVKGSTGSAGKRVCIVDDADALAAILARARTLSGRWILQQHIAGPTFLVGGTFAHGTPLRLYAATKLAQHPPRTGGAIALRSLADPALLAAATATFRELAWTGFASADFMRAPDGRYLLLEVNPRLWGSLAGAADAGVDLFTPFVDLLSGRTSAPDLAFRADVETMIFPRYLNTPIHRTLAGARQALRDLRGPQGADWRDPRLVLHTLRRLYHMRRAADRI